MPVLDLSSLPAPTIIEEISFETILADLMEDANERFATAGIAYDVGGLETDPVKIVLEAAAYRETLLRARVNAAARSNLLAYSTGADLDGLAAFYGVTRQDGELDVDLRGRVVLAILGRSTAGPEEWYEFHARSADGRIREVKAYRVDGGPRLRLALLSKVNGGVPDGPMLAAVTAAVTAADVRSLNDVIEVVSAAQQTINVAAKVWLLPDAPITVFTGLEAVLRAAWAAETGIGFDLNPSWIAARLHVPGVSKVEVIAPALPAVVGDANAIVLGTVTLTNEGRLR